MNLKKKSPLFVAALLALTPALSTWAGGGSSTTYYAALKAQVSGNCSGMGKVYAGTSTSAPSASSYNASSSQSSNQSSTTQNEEKTFTAFAQENEGYEFVGWSTSNNGTTYASTSKSYSVKVKCSSSTESSPTLTTVYANFKKKVLASFGITFETSSAGTYTVDGTAPSNKSGLTEATQVVLASSDPNFLNWVINGTEVTANPYTANCTANTTISAVFLTADMVTSVTTLSDLTSALANAQYKKIMIPAGTTIQIPTGTTVTVPSGKQLVVDGTLVVLGTLSNSGTISGNGTLYKVSQLITQGDVKTLYNVKGEALGNVALRSNTGKPAKYRTTTVTSNSPTVSGTTPGCTVSWGVLLNGTTAYAITAQNPKAVKVTLKTTACVNEITAITGTITGDIDTNADYVLLNNCNLKGPIVVESSKYNRLRFSGTIDLAGKKLTATSYQMSSSFTGLFVNGSIEFGGSGDTAYIQQSHAAFFNCSSVTLKDIKNAGSVFYFYDCGASGSPATISYSYYNSDRTTNYRNAYYYCGVYSYTFSSANDTDMSHVYAGSYSSDPTAYLYNVDEVEAVYNQTTKYYDVREKREPTYVCVIGTTQYESLPEAVTAAGNGDKIALTAAIDLSESTLTIPSSKNITISLDKHTVTGGKIINNGTLTLVDLTDANQGTLGSDIENNGTIDVTYGSYSGNILLNSGTFTTHGGVFTGTISAPLGVDLREVANLRGGQFSKNPASALRSGYSAHIFENNYWVGEFPAPIVTSTTYSGTDKAWKMDFLSSADLALYAKQTDRSEFSSDTDWRRRAELESSIHPYDNYVFDCALIFDRAVEQGSVTFAGKTQMSVTEALDKDLAANTYYPVLAKRIQAAGYTPYTFKRTILEVKSATAGVKNNSTANNGVVCMLESQLVKASANVVGEYDKLYALSQVRYMLGGKKAAIDRGASRLAYDSLASAVSAAQSSERILVGADTAEDVTLPGAGTFTIDPYGFNWTGSASIGQSYLYIQSQTEGASLAEAQGVTSAKAITYVVAAREITAGMISVEGATFTGADLTPAVTVTDAEATLVLGTDYTISYSNNRNVGTAKVTVTGIGNYTGSAEKEFEIAPKAVTVKANNGSKTYGAAEPELTATVTGLVGADTISYELARASGEVVGEYVITASGAATQGNYAVTYEPGTFTITRKAATVTADNLSKTYGAGDPGLTATVSGVVDGGSITYSVTRESGDDAGTYAITASGSAEQGNYAVTFSPGTFTINKATLTATADNKSVKRGETPAYTVSYGGWVNGDDESALTTAPTASCAGYDPTDFASSVTTYEITVSGGSAANYTISPVNGTLTVAKTVAKVEIQGSATTYHTTLQSAADAAVAADGAVVTILATPDAAETVTLTAEGQVLTLNKNNFTFADAKVVTSAASCVIITSSTAEGTVYTVTKNVVEDTEGNTYPSIEDAIRATDGNEITVTITAAVDQEAVLEAGKTLSVTVADGVSVDITVTPAEGAFLETTTSGATTTYESKKITVEMAAPQSPVEVVKVDHGVTNAVSDALLVNEAVNALMGNGDVPRTDNTDKLDVLDVITVTPTKIVEEVVGGNTIIRSATFDVVPHLNAGQTLGEGQTLKFRLPVNAAATQLAAIVSHAGAQFGVYPVQTYAGEKFIEVESADFSPYGYELLDGETANPVAIIGTTGYATLADAIAAVPTDGTATTITMIGDETITGNAGATVAANQNVVLDLNGHTVELAVANASAQAYLIQNNGTLTVNDSGTGGRLYANGEGKGGNNAKCAIQNCGQLTVNGGTISAKSTNAAGEASGAANAIHCPAPDANVSITINGGTLTAEGGASMMNIVTSSAVYIRWNSDSRTLAFTMTGGTLIGGGAEICSAVDVYLGNKAAMAATVNISGGELNGTYAALRMRGGTIDYSGVSTTISGGTFTGFNEAGQTTEWALDVRAGSLEVTGGTFNYGSYLGSHEIDISGGSFTEDVILYRANGTADASISGGTFGGEIIVGGTAGNVSVDEDTNLFAEGKFITGGNFAEPVPEELCAEEYIPSDVATVIGGVTYYTVKRGEYVARNVNTGVGYETLYSAIAAASAGDTITLLADVEASLTISKSLSLTGAHKITGTTKVTAGATVGMNGVTLDANGTIFALDITTGATVGLTNVTVGGGQWCNIHVNGGALEGAGVTMRGDEIVVAADGQTYTYRGDTFPKTDAPWGLDVSKIPGKTLHVPYMDIVRESGSDTVTLADPLSPAGSILFVANMPEDETLTGVALPERFTSYTLTLDADIDFFGGAEKPVTGWTVGNWNDFIDTGATVLVAIDENPAEVPVVLELNDDTDLGDTPFEFRYGNLTIDGNGNTLSGTVVYTDDAGVVSNAVLGTADAPLVIDLTHVTNVASLGNGIVVENVTLLVSESHAADGTEVFVWNPESGEPSIDQNGNISVGIVDENGEPTGDDATLSFDTEAGVAYLGTCVARLTGPTHEKPIYTSLYGAVSQAAQSGDTITLLADVETSLTIGKNLTLTGEYKITGTTKVTAGATVEMNGVTLDAAGSIYALDIAGGASVAMTNVTVGGGQWCNVHVNGGTLTGTGVTMLGDEIVVAGDGQSFTYRGETHDASDAPFGMDLSKVKGETVTLPFMDIVRENGTETVSLSDAQDKPLTQSGSILYLANMPGNDSLDGVTLPARFYSYTLTIEANIGFLGDGTTPTTGWAAGDWNEIIDTGALVLDAIGEDSEEVPVLLTLNGDTDLGEEPFEFSYGNLTVDGGGHALSGTVVYTDDAGVVSNAVLGTADAPLVIDLTQVTDPVTLGADVDAADLVLVLTAEQAQAGTPIFTWEAGEDAPSHENVTIQVAGHEDDSELVWDADMGMAYIGPCEVRLTGPTHELPIYTSLASALEQAASAGDTITLLTNIVDFAGTEYISKSLTLDGAGHTITAAAAADGAEMFDVTAGAVVFKDVTLDGAHKYTYCVQVYGAANLTLDGVTVLHGAKEWSGTGFCYGAGVHVNGGSLVVTNAFKAFSGGKVDEAFPFTGILYDDGYVHFANGVTASIANPAPNAAAGDADLLLVGLVGAPDVSQPGARAEVQAMLEYMNVPAGFYPYTLKIDPANWDSNSSFTGASPLGWNDIIDYGKAIMDAINMSTTETPVEVGLLENTEIPGEFVFEDANFSINGNGYELTGTIEYTASAGELKNVVLTSDTILDISAEGATVNFGEGVSIAEGEKVKLVIGELSAGQDLADNVGDLTIDDFELYVHDAQTDALVPITSENIADYLPEGYEIDKIVEEDGTTKDLVVVKKKYTVSWLDDAGSEIDATTVEHGDVPAHADAVKADSGNTFYTFAGWADALGGSVLSAIPAATNDAAYYAIFTEGAYVAQIVSGATTNKYASLAAAFAAVPTTGAETTITMIGNDTLEKEATLSISSNRNIVLDLNGKTVSGSSDLAGANFYFLTLNTGCNLTVKDTSEGALGKISFASSVKNFSNERVTVKNIGGTLTLESGTIENTTGGGMAYAVNNAVNGGGISTFTMTGGTISSVGGDGDLRIYNNASTAAVCSNNVTISGGTLAGTGIFCDVYLGTPPANYTGDNVSTTLNISGGTINGLIDFKIRHKYNNNFTISGGDFTNAKLRVRKYASEYKGDEPTEPMVTISGGKFAFAGSSYAFGTSYDYTPTSWTTYEKPYAVSGGVFNVAVPAFACAEGYIPVSNTDSATMAAYPHTVAGAVAQVISANGATTNKYDSVEAAVAAASSGDTVMLLKDVDLGSHARNAHDDIVLDGITLDLNGKTIRGFNNGVRYSGNNAVIKNGTFDFVAAEATPSYALSIGSWTDGVAKSTGMQLENLTVNGGINVDNADVTLTNVTINQGAGAYYCLWVDEDNDASATFVSGTINAGANATAVFGVAKASGGTTTDGTLNVQGGTVNANGEELVLASGNHIQVSGGSFDVAVPEADCAPGYIPTAQDPETGRYTVKEGCYVAQIVSGATTNKFESLAAAFAGAQSGDTVQMIADSAETAGGTVAAGKTIVLDLNGKAVSYTSAFGSVFSLISVNGNLTVDDTSAGAAGSIAITSTANLSWDYAVNLFLVGNGGSLTIEKGDYSVSTPGYGYAEYVIAASNNSGSSTVTVNGGTFTGNNIDAVVRLHDQYGRSQPLNVTINGGDFTLNGGSDSVIWFDVQNSGSGTDNTSAASLAINGGTFTSTSSSPALDLGHSVDASGLRVTVTGGAFKSNGAVIKTRALSAAAIANIKLSGGIYSGDEYYDDLAKETAKLDTLCADKYACVASPDSATAGAYPWAVVQAAFTVIFQNYDGTGLQTNVVMVGEETPSYTGETPTKQGGGFVYQFDGWTAASDSTFYAATNALPAIVADETFTAHFIETPSYLDAISWTGAVSPAEGDPKLGVQEVSVQQSWTGNALRIHRTADEGNDFRPIGEADDDLRISWNTSNSAIATIDGNGLLTFHDLGTVAVTVTVTDAFGNARSSSSAVTYRLWPENIRITGLDYENRRLWYDFGTEEQMVSFLPAAAENGKIVRTVYCTFLTATDLAATEWTAVNNSFEWEKNDEGRDGWRSFGTIDTSAIRRFWRLVVTLDPLVAGQTVSFGSQATGN